MTTVLRFPDRNPSPRSAAQRTALENRPLRTRRKPPLQPMSGVVRPAGRPLRTANPNSAPWSTQPIPLGGVQQFPEKRPMPTRLRLLMTLQRGSLVLTFLLVAAALVVYSTTMYTQQLWSKEYNTLKRMHRSERQMLATNELLKNQLIQQAEQPGSGLVPKSSEYTVSLEPAPLRPAPPPPPVFSKSEPVSDQGAAPLGY